jgi:hypothetical protein
LDDVGLITRRISKPDVDDAGLITRRISKPDVDDVGLVTRIGVVNQIWMM